MAKIKKMCKTSKDGLKANEDEILNEVRTAKFICKKCIRVASDKKNLCDPKKL